MSKLVSSKSLAGPSEICMLMPIRQGFTLGLATRSYESRLRSFTKLFSDLRAVTRESRRLKPFSDIVDRLRTILGVTISIVDGQLLLVVHFDRPWEPYIRLVWRDLGHVFDLILCNCEGYVEAHRNNLGFEAFAGWIRKHQVDASTFYLEGNHTVDDVIYLDRLEKAVRHDDADAATLAQLGRETPEERAAAARAGLSGDDYVEFIKMGVQAVAAFHALTFLYPKGTSDHNYLLRTARAILPPAEFPRQQDWDLSGLKEPALRQLQGVFYTELNWFELWPDEEQLPPPPEPGLPFDPHNVQGGIASSYGADVGCLVLLQVVEPASARRFLDGFAQQVSWGGTIGADGLYRNLAFTAEGLARLELPQAELAKLPAAFREGMAARAGLIGDLRHNHPDQWSLPERNWPRPKGRGKARARAGRWQTVNLEAVDVVIQLRRHSGQRGDRSGDDPELMAALDHLAEESAGALLILGYQSMYSQGSAQAPQEHFGFRDGISNPRLDPEHPDAPDVVPAGDLFLGQPNSRGDRLPEKWSEPLFKDGSFQVIRKLAQDVPALHEAVDANLDGRVKARARARDALLAKMMGRDKRGVPLADPEADIDDNSFDYDNDPHGERVPTFAHVRRANPRDRNAKDGMPRIVRRGMSYGPRYPEAGGKSGASAEADRGLIFQAYNASLDEQFEVINRWLTGDNRTAPYSRLSDPYLGVPERGERRVYRFADGGKLDLGERPFVRLCWGLYLFAPSRVGLSVIAGPRSGEPERDWKAEGLATIDRLTALEAQDRELAFRAWKRVLEEKESLDEESHRGIWQAVRERHNGVLRTPFGVLVGSAALVRQVLTTPADFSVAGYDERLSRCVGANYLGMDPPLHDEKATAANYCFHQITREEAFEATFERARGLLEGLSKVGGQATIPMLKYVDLTLAEVCKFFFGVPDQTTLLERGAGKDRRKDAAVEAGGEPPAVEMEVEVDGRKVRKVVPAPTSHCPHHVISSSRFVFQPQPSDPVDATATAEGRRLRRAMDSFVAALPQRPSDWGKPHLEKLFKTLKAEGLEADFSAVLLGALLGYMPTVQGNFLFSTRDWLRDRDFWRVQNEYLACRQQGRPEQAAAFETIAPWLERTMARRPIPAMIHRRATRDLTLGDLAIRQGEMLVVGLVSAAAESGFNDVSPAFGGNYEDEPKATHACPGQKLGMGTLLGMIAALFELEGTLRRAPSTSALLYDPP